MEQSASTLSAAAARLRRDVDTLLAEQAARYEAELLEREQRIASLTAQLARARDAPSTAPRDSASLDRVFASFLAHLPAGDGDEGAPGPLSPVAEDGSDVLRTAPSPASPPHCDAPSALSPTARPTLTSHLSASGTDFEKFSSVAKLSRTSRGAAQLGGGSALAASSGSFVPVPVAEAVDAGARMEPQPRPSPGLGIRNKQIHLNDVSSLSLKQRRKQSKQLQQQQQPLNTTASGGDSSDAETYTRALTAPNGLPTASQTTASAAPEPIATSGTTETCAGDGDAPKRRHSVGGGLRGASPVLGREGSIAMQTFPSHDLVQEVLHERTSSSSLTASPNNGRHAVRRKESVIKRKFRSAFPSSSSKHKREQLVRSDSSAINLSGTMDGGFAEHAKEFKQQPLFERSAGHRVETYPQSPGWSFAMDSLTAPTAFERPFEAFCNGVAVRPRIWAWKSGLCVVAAVPTADDEGVRLVLHCAYGTQSVLVRLANVDVLSKVELLRQLLAIANPLIPADECVRVRGETATRLIASATLFERRFAPQSIDVAVVKYLRPETGLESPVTGLDGKKRGKPASPFERFVANLAGRSDGVVAETGECVSYVWENCTIRLNFVSSKDARALALYRVRVCFVDAEMTAPAQDSGADVVVAVREAAGLPKYFHVSCLHNAAVPQFGPPLFPEPLRDKLLQPVLSCKLLNAVAMLRHTIDAAQLCAERTAVLKTMLEAAE